MTTNELTGRELNAAVARAMGWRWVSPATTPSRCYLQAPHVLAQYLPEYVSDDPPKEKRASDRAVPAYSDPSCTGLAPVLAGLRESPDVSVIFESDRDEWRAMLVPRGGKAVAMTGDSLPTAACRLLVAWAERRATT